MIVFFKIQKATRLKFEADSGGKPRRNVDVVLPRILI